MWGRDLIGITLALVVLFGLFLGMRPLTVPDEGRYAEIPREMVVSGDYVTPHLNSIKYFEKPPFFYWVQVSSIRLFGLNEWGVRIPNALFGLFGVLLTYSCARVLYGRRTGLLSAGVLSTSLMYIGMTQMVTLDMTTAVLLSGALFSFILGNQVPAGRKRDLFMWAMYACAALATLTKGLIGIVLPGAIIFAWILVTGRWRDLKTYCLPTGGLLFLLIALPWHIIVALRNPEFAHFYFIDQQFLRYLTDSTGRNQSFWFLPLVLFGGFFPWLGFLIPAYMHEQPKMWRPPVSQHATLFLLLWADIITLFFWPSNSMLAPYVLPIYPPLAIITARYLNWAIDHPNHWGVRFGIIVLGVTSAVLIGAGVLTFGLSHPFMNLSLSLLILTTLLSFWLIWRYSLTRAIVGLTIAISVFFISLKLSYPETDKRTIKSLALTLKPLLKDHEPVYTYWDYYQDLPVYLNQPVTIVQYYGELQHGITQHNPGNAWIPLEVFWQRWYQPRRQYMITSLTTYADAKKTHPDAKFIELGRTERNILVTNLDR